MDKLNIDIKPEFIEDYDDKGGVSLSVKNVVSIQIDGITNLKEWLDIVEKVTGCLLALDTEVEDDVLKDIVANGNQGKTFAEKLQEKIQENKNKNQ